MYTYLVYVCTYAFLYRVECSTGKLQFYSCLTKDWRPIGPGGILEDIVKRAIHQAIEISETEAIAIILTNIDPEFIKDVCERRKTKHEV